MNEETRTKTKPLTILCLGSHQPPSSFQLQALPRGFTCFIQIVPLFLANLEPPEVSSTSTNPGSSLSSSFRQVPPSCDSRCAAGPLERGLTVNPTETPV